MYNLFNSGIDKDTVDVSDGQGRGREKLKQTIVKWSGRIVFVTFL